MRPGFDVEHIFTHHAPTEEQVEKYLFIRSAAKAFAEIILANTPPSADQSDALRKIRETVMTANASIALGGRLHKEEPKT